MAGSTAVLNITTAEVRNDTGCQTGSFEHVPRANTPAAVAAGERRVVAALAHADLAVELGRFAETVPNLRALAARTAARQPGPGVVGWWSSWCSACRCVLTRAFPTLVPYEQSLEVSRLVLHDQVPANANEPQAAVLPAA